MILEVHPLRHKSDVITRFKEFKARHKRPPDRKIRRLRADGGGEYGSQAFQNYLKLCGITFEPTSRESPEQNPVSERFNRDIGEKARAMRLSGGIADAFWPELVQTSNYMSMRSPSSRLGGITPYEAWHQEKPDLSHIRSIGSLVFVRTVGHRSKLADRSKPYILVGFSELTNKQYRVIDPRATRRDLMIKPRMYDVHIEERRLTALDNSDKESPVQKIRKINSVGKPQWDPNSGEKFENYGPIAEEPRAMGSNDNDPPVVGPVARSTSTRSASPDPLRITARDL